MANINPIILGGGGGTDISDADAAVTDVVAPKTFYAGTEPIKTGTMVDRGTVSTDISAKATEVPIEAGKHSGSGVVKIATAEQDKIIAANIKKDISILGVTGTVEAGGSTTGHLVRYFDPFGTLLKTEYVTNGANATAPTPPTIALLTFAEWNHPGTNITRDENIGAIYDTTDGKTYIFVHVNALTGLQPTIRYHKSTADEMTINWGDSTTNTSTSTGNLNTQKTAAYAAAGNYTITITCAGTYNLGNGTTATTLFGAHTSNNYTSIAQKVYFGANTTVLFANVFYNYYGIDAITLSSGMTGGIGASAFYNCTSLASLTLSSGMTGGIGTYAFYNCTSLVSLTLPSGMTGTIGAAAFLVCYSLASLTLPSGMTGFIEIQVFYDCRSLASLTLPSGMTGTIGATAFQNCYALASLTLPSGMTGIIAHSVFLNCHSLTSITLPSGCTGIDASAFQQLRSLRSLTIPSGFTSIGANAFNTNSAMDEYIFEPTTPPTLAATTAFTGIRLWTRIYVPDASVAAYKAATNWSTYANYIYSINDRP